MQRSTQSYKMQVQATVGKLGDWHSAHCSTLLQMYSTKCSAAQSYTAQYCAQSYTDKMQVRAMVGKLGDCHSGR